MAKSKCSFWNGGKRSKLLLDIKLKDLRNEIYTFDFKVLQSFKPYALRKEFKSQRGGGISISTYSNGYVPPIGMGFETQKFLNMGLKM